MKYFGTDGVRGVAGADLTCELAFRLPRAAGHAFRPRKALARPAVQAAIQEARAMLDGTGRLVVRPSGTQALIRIMAEGPDEAVLHHIVNRIESALAPHRADAPGTQATQGTR